MRVRSFIRFTRTIVGMNTPGPLNDIYFDMGGFLGIGTARKHFVAEQVRDVKSDRITVEPPGPDNLPLDEPPDERRRKDNDQERSDQWRLRLTQIVVWRCLLLRATWNRWPKWNPSRAIRASPGRRVRGRTGRTPPVGVDHLSPKEKIDTGPSDHPRGGRLGPSRGHSPV